MPDPSNQASLQRRANWVGFRTLRQRPKLVGATPGGEPVYEIRSVRLVLRGLSPHFDRLAPCSRCGKEVPAAPVLNVADLERALRPVICTACVRDTGVSTVWDSTGARPRAIGAPVAEASGPKPAEPAPASETGAEKDATLESLTRHLRAVTVKVNELGKHLGAERAASEQRRQREEEVRAALAGLGDQVDAQRAEVAAVLSAVTDVRSQLERLAESNRTLAQANRQLEAEAAVRPSGPPGELATVVDAQQELSRAHGELAQRLLAAEARWTADPSEIRREVAGVVEEVEGRLANQIARQWGDLETAIESSVKIHASAIGRSHREMADVQAEVVERLDALAAHVAQVGTRMDALAAWAASTNIRLDALEERAERAFLASPPAPDTGHWDAAADAADESPTAASSGGLLDTLERQLQAASSRLAARAERAPADS